MTTEAPAAPFAELHTLANYELTVTVDFDFQNYATDEQNRWVAPTAGAYRVEAGREACRWRTRVARVIGKNEEGFAVTEPPPVDVRDQDAGPDPLTLLRALLTGDGRTVRRERAKAVINDVRCDPATAELVYISPAGHNCYTPEDGFRRFDEVLYRNDGGHYFLVRPLAPDEARDWLEDGRHDRVLARQHFPDED